MPHVIHELADRINRHLGAIGSTVRRIDSPVVRNDQLPQSSRNVIVLGDESALLDSVQNIIQQSQRSVVLASHKNRNAISATWLVPESHFMETWSDARAHDGTASVVQPMISPLYKSMSAVEVLSALMNDAESGYDSVRKTWTMNDAEWETVLANGVIPNTAFEQTSESEAEPAGIDRPSEGYNRPAVPRSDETIVELQFLPDPSVWDGRFANNGWLQELPKPLTHVVWDNPAWIAPADAANLKLQNGDLARLSAGKRAIEIPVWIVPGHAQGCVTLFHGYGLGHAGRVARETGFDVGPLLGSQRATITNLHHSAKIVTTQHHQAMSGRHLARSGSLNAYLDHPAHPEFAHPASPLPEANLHPAWSDDGHKWGMTIDLTACVGCSACVLACQAENNIPVVGKTQCDMNRHMHWIRVDTYYKGSADLPDQTLHQPVPCMHCELAPCEVVCPVAATSHSDEGLNQMVYNRCIGTRYCSNNCPYKVRRFNFHDYSNDFVDTPVMELLSNPEVSLRSRGVMEKCTYCVQRIENARIARSIEGDTLRDGDIRTACQSVCPSAAIRFGDLNDPKSEVAIAAKHPLNYSLLEEINTKPRTTYLAEVNNRIS
ncbi:MAG: 4Fe-4S dicluster domain-containing protein [Pirellulaceae bacterium]